MHEGVYQGDEVQSFVLGYKQPRITYFLKDQLLSIVYSCTEILEMLWDRILSGHQ